MPPFSALLHTHNDALRLGRALETLLPCAEILIVDNHSNDTTVRLARRYGARVFSSAALSPPTHYLQHAQSDWILHLNPSESLTEGLQASLFEWSAAAASHFSTQAFSVNLLQQLGWQWRQLAEPEIRLVHKQWPHWKGLFPAPDGPSTALQGDLLQLAYP